tara:strand:+ start:21 stop:1397 length:1377 start_codon:yes stop_codon:yes gene_type:complete
MAYSKSNKRSTSPKRSNASNRRKPKFPTSPILPRGNKYAPRKIVRKKPNTDDRFEVIEETYTPFARSTKIEALKESRSEYEFRSDFDYSLGSISVKPANKNRIASDEGDEDGNIQIPTEKVNRTTTGVIISTEESEELGENMIVANARFVFEDANFKRIVDTEISELAIQPKPLDGPNKAPTVIGVQCYPGYGLLDGTRSDGYTIQTLPEIGETSYQLPSNNNVAFWVDAYSFIDDDGQRIDEGLTYTWRFTADGIGSANGSVIGNSSVLRLYNVQLQQRGRYTCEVSNEKGSVFSQTLFLNPLGGLLRELDENSLPTGALVRDVDHDEQFSQFDDYFDFDPEDGRWFLAEWNGNQWVESNQEPNFYKGKDLPKSTNQAKTLISKASSIAQSSANKSRSRAIGKYYQDSTSYIFFIESGKPTIKFNSVDEFNSHKSSTGFDFQGTNEVDKLTYKDQEL